MTNPEPSGIVFPVRPLTDAEFTELKDRWQALHGMVGCHRVTVLPDPHYNPTYSLFIRSTCCDTAVYQVEDFAADCLLVVCARCGSEAGSPGREDVELIAAGRVPS